LGARLTGGDRGDIRVLASWIVECSNGLQSFPQLLHENEGKLFVPLVDFGSDLRSKRRRTDGELSERDNQKSRSNTRAQEAQHKNKKTNLDCIGDEGSSEWGVEESVDRFAEEAREVQRGHLAKQRVFVVFVEQFELLEEGGDLAQTRVHLAQLGRL
jgi:hypothetical protein